MYQNYIFDLYGTLADIRTAEHDRQVWEKLRLFYGYYGALYTAGELQEAYENLVNGGRQEHSGSGSADGKAAGTAFCAQEPHYGHEAYPEISLGKVFAALFTGKGVCPDEALVLHAGQLFRVLTTEYLRLYDGASEMLAELRRRGKQTYLLTNAQRMFTEYELRLLGIADSFNGILISSDYGIKKPDSRFFGRLLEQYSLKPEKSIMIGNDETCDIAGAKRVGMAACYLHSDLSPEYTGTAGADYVQEKINLRELCTLLCR